MACRYLSLTETKKDDETKKAGETDWFKAWYSAVKIPKASAHRMWDEFKLATGLSITPSKA